MGNWDNYLKVRNFYLNPALVIIHKIMHQFDTDYYQPNDRSLITAVKENSRIVKKCFPSIETGYSFENCLEVC